MLANELPALSARKFDALPPIPPPLKNGIPLLDFGIIQVVKVDMPDRSTQVIRQYLVSAVVLIAPGSANECAGIVDTCAKVSRNFTISYNIIYEEEEPFTAA